MDEAVQIQLIKAIKEQRQKKVKQILQNRHKSGLDINAINEDGWTHLMRATDAGNTEMVKLLLQCVEIQVAQAGGKGQGIQEGDQAIHWSAERGNVRITELLLDKGADVNAIGSYGWTPLIDAASTGYTSCAELLLDRGARVEDRNNAGRTALMRAASNNHIPCTNLLLDRGADINVKDAQGVTALYKAAMWGDLPIVDLLLRRGAEVGWEGEKSPLQAAKKRGKRDVIELLENHRKKWLSDKAENILKQTEPRKAIHVYDVAQRFIKSLGLSDAFYESKFDVCFCANCHAKRKDELVYLRGNPPRKYGLPIGWCKFGLKTKPLAEAIHVFDNWHMAFHGTRVDSVVNIIEAGDLLLPGDTTPDGYQLKIPVNHWDPKHPDPKMRPPPGHDVKKFYFSPSIKYSGCEVYAPIHRWTDTMTGQQHYIRVALQARVRPGSYQVGDQTIGRKETIDPLFPNAELEWSTNRRSVAILVGMLVKIEDLVGDPDIKVSDLPDKPEVQRGLGGGSSFRAEFKRDYIHENSDGKEITLRAGEKCWVIHQADKMYHVVHHDVNEPIILAAHFLRKL